MTQPGSLIEEAPDDTPIWRYMDLARFVSLVFSRKLWFPKLRDLWLNDPWEGFGRAKGLRRPSRSLRKTWPASEAARVLYAESSGYAAETVRNAHQHVYASSWCRGSQSLGMWERYGNGAGGLAIESTVARFKDGLERKLKADQYAFGVVQYDPDLQRSARVRSDFTKGTVLLSGKLWQRTLSIAFNKRTFYEDENEWRAAIFQEQKRPEDVGLLIPSDLDVLIRTVRIGPRADRPTIDAVKAVMKAAGLDKPLEESSILKRPRIRRSR